MITFGFIAYYNINIYYIIGYLTMNNLLTNYCINNLWQHKKDNLKITVIYMEIFWTKKSVFLEKEYKKT